MADQIDCTLPDGNLPVDITVSILSNLPVKSLLRFKAVCKSWRSLISSPLFIKTYLLRQSVIANNLLTTWEGIDVEYDENIITEFSLLNHNYDISWSSVEEGVDVFDSCKGLVCLCDYKCEFPESKKYLLWNPATRRYRSLELPNKPSCPSFRIIGLGFVEATNDYKIVGLAHTDAPANDKYMFVYTLSSDSWKELDYCFNDFPTDPVSPTFMNGCLHWLRACSSWRFVNKIFAFDVANEVMRYFGVPDCCYELSWKIVAIKGCLSIVSFPDDSQEMETGIEIWIMEQYGVEASWAKKFTIKDLTVERPIGSWKDSEIVFVHREENSLGNLMFYEPFSRKTNSFEHSCYFSFFDACEAFNYVECLVSVDRTQED